MNELIGLLTSKEIIVVYIVAAVACALGFTIYIIDKNYYKRKQRHNTKELNKLVEEVNEIIENEYEEESKEEVFNTPVLETIEPVTYSAKVNEEIIVETPIVSEIKVEEVKQEVVEEEFIEQLEDEELEPISIEEIVPDTIEEEPVVEEVKVEEELTYTSIEPNRQQAQEELMRLTLELEKAEQEQKNIDLTAYEEEQEENAIISLDELVAKSKEMYEANEVTQYADEGNEPISLEDLERRMNKVQEEVAAIESIEEPISVTEITAYDEPVITETFDLNAIIPALEEKLEEPQQMVLDDFNSIKVEPVVEETKIEPVRPAYQATKKFERSPVISPIYGIERQETKEELELENTANYEKLDEEIKKTNEFLMTLRELQKNLD
ncbi:MAG: hypothetical protein IJA30_05610 [Bacilli bacterium]|nr:hypothetical protein [Bacilli bacterium]